VNIQVAIAIFPKWNSFNCGFVEHAPPRRYSYSVAYGNSIARPPLGHALHAVTAGRTINDFQQALTLYRQAPRGGRIRRTRVHRKVSSVPESIVLKGDKIGLAAVGEQHIECLVSWLNDPMVIPGVTSRQIHNAKSVMRRFTEIFNGNESVHGFIIIALENEEPVGTTQLFDIDHVGRTAEFGIFMGTRSRGYGTEATQLTIDWAFHILGMRNVLLRVGSWNSTAIAMYKRCGFKRIGTRRDGYAFGGRAFDEELMDITPADVASRTSRVLPLLPSGFTSGLSIEPGRDVP
jgi:diamine N-acetyltransferase